MDLQDLQIFREVVLHDSVQAAAKALGLSKSSLRRKLEQLEAEIGEPLLLFGADGVELSPAGQVVLERGRRVLEDVDNLVEHARAANQTRGELRLITPIGMPDALRVRLLGSLLTLYPNIRVSTRESENPLDLIDQPFELLVHYGTSPDNHPFFSRVLRRVRLGLLATPGYLERAGVPERVEQLAEHTLLALRLPGRDTSRWPLTMGGEFSVLPNFVTSNLQLLRAATVEGLGISFGPVGDVSDFDLAHKLVPVLGQEVGTAINVRVLSPPLAKLEPGTRTVMENIQRQLSSLPAD